MKTKSRFPMTGASLLLFLFAGAVATTAGQSQDGAQTREQAALIEEQELLTRKLLRIVASMTRLAEQFEAEGRVHAAELLREGLSHVASREEGTAGQTLEERMNGTMERLRAGQITQSMESQQAIIKELESLISILMDRPDLDEIENEIEKLKRQEQALQSLAENQKELREKTEQLRQDSSNEAQRKLEEQIEAARKAQRELLRQNEEHSRQAGAIDLERLEQDLSQLRQDQHMDTQVLRDWDPASVEPLEALVQQLEQAQLENSRARRLQLASELLQESTTGEDLAEQARDLEAAAEAAKRAARASGDPSAEAAAEALERGAEQLRQAATDSGKREASEQELEALAAQMKQEAEQRSANAADLREQVAQGLERLEAQAKGTTKQVADEVGEALQQASQDPQDLEQNEAIVRDATEQLRDTLEQAKFLAQALKSSQELNAERAQALREAIDRLPQDLGEQGDTAKAALEKAEEEMLSAARQADEQEARASEQSAARAEQALEQAQDALAQGREQSAQEPGSQSAERNSQMAAAQEQLAREVEDLSSLAPEASMNEASERAVEEHLQAAQEAMEKAAEEMKQGRNASAASSQREASEALSKAASEASEGVQPQTEEQKQQAQDLAEQQKQLEKELYEFKREYDEQKSEDSPALDSLAKAQASAKQAVEDLQQEKLESAQEEQDRTQQEIEQAIDELKREEEQYQKLRSEELLFKIAEEVAALLEPHERVAIETREVERSREPGSRVSRGQKLRLRKLARTEAALAARAAELQEEIEKEGSLVFAELLSRLQDDLESIATRMGDSGGYQSGERLQALQSDVSRDLGWLSSALEEEQDRRKEEQEEEQNKPEEEKQDGEQPPPAEGENRLVPDVAELKLLSRMDLDVLDNIEELLVLYPELQSGEDLHPLLLEEIQRLAHRHERTSALFKKFRERLGIAAPDADGPLVEPDEADTESGQPDSGATKETEE